MKFKEAKSALEAALADYRATSNPTAAQNTEHTAKIKAARKAVSDAITEGAMPCPGCGERPHGMEQPTVKSKEFELGCLSCKPFIHEDGTGRAFRVRGGLMPRHAVEAWNEGPDLWMVVPVTEGMKLRPTPEDDGLDTARLEAGLPLQRSSS